MSMSFRVSTLSGDLVRQALPVIQATWPDADLASWQSFAEFFTGPRASGEAGGLVLHDPAGYICGVLTYRLNRDMRAGSVLDVHLFTAVDLANSLQTVRALFDAAEARACELGCTCIQIRLYDEQARLASCLRILGLVSDARLFRKQIDPAQIRN